MSVELVGRDEEVLRAEQFVTAVPRGARALVIEGEAGAGKTALWETAVRSARRGDMLVLEARPAEAEASFAHAALGDLVREHRDAVAGLPDLQRRALEAAVLLAESSGGKPEPQVVALAALGVLRALAGERPVVVAVDDVQWLDPPSAAVLAFAARRLRDERVGLLLAHRTAGGPAPIGLERAFDEDRLLRLPVPPLSLGAVLRLLQVRLDFVPARPVLHRLYELSGGNPFFALELARAVRAGSIRLEPGERLPGHAGRGDERQAGRPVAARAPGAGRGGLAAPADGRARGRRHGIRRRGAGRGRGGAGRGGAGRPRALRPSPARVRGLRGGRRPSTARAPRRGGRTRCRPGGARAPPGAGRRRPR